MTPRAATWALVALAILPVLGCLLPGRWPGVDQLVALLPAVPLIAVAALLLGRRGTSWVVAVAAILGAGVIVARELVGPTVSKDGPTMVLVTHNVARQNTDPAATAAALVASHADVLFLQETDGTFAPYLPMLRRQYPYGNSCLPRCSLAILSRWPLARVRWRFHDTSGRAFGPGLLATTVVLPWGGTTLLATVHLSRERAAAARAAERDRLAAAAQRAGPASLILGGDLNLSPWGSSMRRLEAALAPMTRVTRAVFTFPANGPFSLPLVPIDHVFVGPAWRVAAVQRMARTGSDHYPVRVKLLWQPPRL